MNHLNDTPPILQRSEKPQRMNTDSRLVVLTVLIIFSGLLMAYGFYSLMRDLGNWLVW